jgi:polyisoprenoid-binding protein YceI
MALETWQIDPTHSTVGFSVRHMMFAKVHGRFGSFTATLAVDKDDVAKSSVEVAIDAASIDTNEAQRDGHLKSADFFDVEHHPKLAFKSTGVKVSGGDVELAGDLTIRGTTKPVVLKGELGFGKDPWGNERLIASVATSIDRKEFGLAWNAVLEAGGVLVSDKVEIHIEAQAIRPKA